jgi:glycogen debranching enzyme
VDEGIRVRDRFYILASSSIADETSRILKHSETFLVTDRHGDVRPLGFEEHGLFHEGTRFLSRLVLKLQGKSPLLLSSTIKKDNDLLMVDLTNPDFLSRDGMPVHSGTVHLNRSVFLWECCCYERIRISNYGLAPVSFLFSLEFDVDFVDIFEVRGMNRKARGERLEPVVEDESVVLSYRGLDGVVRRARLIVSPVPDELSAGHAGFFLTLDPQCEADYYLTVSCETGGEEVKPFDRAIGEVRRAYNARREGACVLSTSNVQFNDWLDRSMADLYMMLTRTPQGDYPYAGIPWFNTIFGRDGIITALETLWMHPEIARGVLGYLSACQAREVLPERDAEPGKILHEERRGEMANLDEIPFGRYYGTVDATPLFVVLAGHYFERTGDGDFIRRLWPSIERALGWIDGYGDPDKDGFFEYARSSYWGLVNQGWKDSEDSVFHEDGTLASPPIALCEVQGYVYEAKLKAAQIAFAIGKLETGEKLLQEAETLRVRFLEAFWCEELGTYALALDGEKRPCRIKSSNAGHALFSGIAGGEHAARIVQGLMDELFFTGWGVRTLASSQVRYNPMSYHNGAVWPHDNALIALGMGRYGYKEEAARILTGLFEASIFMDLHRLPELFCGFQRRKGEGPTLYPVACDPQAWASGAAFLALKACLGISIEARENRVCFTRTTLPPFLQEVTIRNLRVGKGSLDIVLQRYEQDVGVNVLRREGDVEVVITK